MDDERRRGDEHPEAGIPPEVLPPEVSPDVAPAPPEEPDRPVVGWAPPPGTSTAPYGGWAPSDAGRAPVMDVGRVVGRTFAVFGREWSLFMVLSAPVAIAYAIQGFVLPGDAAAVLGLTLIGLVVGLLTVTAVTVAADAVAEGRPIGIAEATVGGLRAVPWLLALLALVLVVVAGVGALAALLLAGVGATPGGAVLLLLLIAVLVPVGILVSLRLTPVLGVLVLERARPIHAIRRSWDLSRGRALAIFGITFTVSLATAPALWGASLMALEPGPAAAIALGVATLLTTALTAIAATLIYRDLTAAQRPVPGEPAPSERAGRAIGLGLVLGVGSILLVVGFGLFGSRLGELTATTIPSPGAIRAGHAEGFLDPCVPGDLATEFVIGDEIWIGGYFTRTVQGGDLVEVSLYLDGEALVDAEPLASGDVPFNCYFEIDPFVPQQAGTYRLELVNDGEVIGTGGFTVTE